MAFGYGAKAFSKIGAKDAIVRIAKDALQEGMEEYFQDFSSYTIDRIFSIWSEDYKDVQIGLYKVRLTHFYSAQ